jgi:CRP-like cAMP-binding protein
LYEEKHSRLGGSVEILFLFQINRISKGGYFGELALVTHKPRAASAYAVGNMKLACEYTWSFGDFKA